jgi:streptomycin 6-kinase
MPMTTIVDRSDPKNVSETERRFRETLKFWNVEAETWFRTETSMIGMGKRGNEPAVVKMILDPNDDEWNSGAVVEAFEGKGMVRLLERRDGAMLLEKLDPGTPLFEMVLDGRDQEATTIIASIILQMTPRGPPAGAMTAARLARGFDRHKQRGSTEIPKDLVNDAMLVYRELLETQKDVRLLHGDLQHYNVLRDAKREWVAIDPKGVVAEREFEIGAALRNPWGKPELFSSRPVIERRVNQYADALGLDRTRIKRWAFAQAVLSAIWSIEDSEWTPPDLTPLRLARVLRSMLG